MPHSMSKELKIAVGERLTRTREAIERMEAERGSTKRKPTQAEFAERFGVKDTTWNNYETGKRALNIEAAIELCNKMKITLDWLFRNEMDGLPLGLVRHLKDAQQDSPPQETVVDIRPNVRRR